ncbi:MAG: hypothetical protein JNL11_05730 [Bdellovibrionaceae bacterium]|nr:hypothetical protein [Pseudobdellovibrionaceae bacterium]
MLSKCSLALLLILIGIESWANRIGNGGNVTVCADAVSLLDFYESKTPPKYKGDAGSIEYKLIAKDVFKRMARVSKKLSNQYSERLDSVQDEIDFLDNVALTNAEDSLHVFKPADKDCDVKQIAIRKEVSLPGEKRFVFDKKLWDRLDAQNQAGLLVHEIVYEHFNKLGEVTSPKVRKVVGYLFQDEINAKDFWNLIKSLKLPLYPD